jgi:membrane-associated phospholipid phosphatase
MTNSIKPASTTNPIRLFPVLLFAAALSLLLLLIHLTDEIIFEQELAFDKNVQHWVSTIRVPWATSVMQVFTFLGSFYFIIPGYVLLIWRMFRTGNRTRTMVFAALIVLSAIAILVAKIIFHRQRPELPFHIVETGYSYPSGHAASAAIFFCWVLYFFLDINRWKHPVQKLLLYAGALLFIGLIGFSRIYLNVHYATDVLAGFFLGFLYFLLSVVFLRRFNRTGNYPINSLFRIGNQAQK